MKICITPKSIQLLATYFKRAIPDILKSFDNNITYDDLINAVYEKALDDFKDTDFTSYTKGYVLQHLSIVPQMVSSWASENPANQLKNNEMAAKINDAKNNIYNASQSKNNEDLSLEILKMADIVGVVPIEIIQLSEEEHFDAVSYNFARSILQEDIFDAITGYKENKKDPTKIFETNIQHEILRTNNINNYRFKLVEYSSIVGNKKSVDTTEFKDNNRVVMVIVNQKNEIVEFDDKGKEVEEGSFPIFKIKTNKTEFEYQVKALAMALSYKQDLTIEEATNNVEERLDAHLENISNAISKIKNSKEVYFEMDMATSSKGFVELNEKFKTPISKITNLNENSIYIDTQTGSRNNPAMIRIPYSDKPVEIKENSLDQLNVEDRNILVNLFFNNNLKDKNGNPMSQGMRRTMIQRYVVFNAPNSPNSDQRARLTMSFADKGKSNQVQYVVFNGKKVYPPSAGSENNLVILGKAFDIFASSYVAIPTPSGKKVPGRDVAKSLDDVTFNKQYYRDENNTLKLAAKPDISFGLITGVDKNINVSRDVVTSIVDDVYTLGLQNLKGHIIANGYTIAMPTKTNEGLILRGHGSYIGFNPMISNMDIDVTGEAVFRSLDENNLATKSVAKKGAAITAEASEDAAAELWYKDIKQNPLGQILRLNDIDKVNVNGEAFVSNFFKDSINLFKGHRKIDLYHETFHAYFRGLLTPEKRAEIYKELRAQDNSFTTTVKGVTSTQKFSNGTPALLEEYLAVEFTAYGIGRSKYNKLPKSKVAQFFEWLLSTLKSVFGNKTVNEVVVLNKMGPIVSAIFKDLYEGNVDASKFIAPTSKALSEEAWHSYDASKSLKLSIQEMSITMSSIQQLMSEYINIALNSTSTADSNGAVMKKMVQLSTLDINGKDYKKISDSLWNEIHSINKSLKYGGVNGYGVFRLNESPVALTYALNYVKESLNQRLEFYKNLDGVISKQNVKLLTTVLANFGDTNAPKESFKGDDKSILGVFFNNQNIISIEKMSEYNEALEDAENETKSLADRLVYGKTGAEFSPYEVADTYTEQLLSSISKYTGQGEGELVTNRIGIARPLQFKTAIGKVVRMTKGLTLPSEMYSAMLDVSETDKEISQIVLKLGPPNAENISRSVNRQWGAFWSSIVRASQDLAINILEKVDVAEGSEAVYIAKRGKLKEGSSIVGREWKGNFIDNLSSDAPYIDDGLLDPTKLIETFDDLYADELLVESIETLKAHAKRRDVVGYEKMNENELIRELAGRKEIPLSGSSLLYHNNKQGSPVTYRNNPASFYIANPFPLLKAMGIILPETREIRDLLSFGDPQYDIPSGIMNLLQMSFYNRENAIKEEDKLVENFDDLFSQYTYSFYNSDTQTDEPAIQPDLSGYISIIKSIGERMSDDFVSSTDYNAKGDRQTTRPYHSTLSLQVATINNAKDDMSSELSAYDKLIAIPGMESFDYRYNPQIAANPWLVGMFQLNHPDLAVRGTRREDMSITIDTIGGSVVKYGSSDRGITSLASDAKTKYNTDFVNTLLGRQEIFRTEAKKSSLVVFGSQFVRGDVTLRKGIVFDAQDVETIFSKEYKNITGYRGLLLYNQFVGHLEAELVRISRIKALKQAVKDGEEIEFDQAYIDRGEKFYMFDLIFKGKSKQLGNNLIKKNITESFTLNNALSNAEKKEIENALRDYFVLRSNDEFNNYSYELTIPENLKESFKIGEEENEVTTKRLVQAFIVNNFVQNANFASAFLGDVALYDVAGEGFHKRIAGLISTGTLFRFDDDMYNFLNREDYGIRGFAQKHAKNNNITLDKYQYEGYLHTGVMKEAMFASVYSEHYDTFYKGESPKETVEYRKKMEIADGAAYMTFDAYRMLADSNNDWLPEQEDIYQKLLRGESLNQLKVSVAFPVKKYQHYGFVTNDNARKNVFLNMMAFHKYAILPLIPGVGMIEGTPLEDLNNKMMENGMDYVTFKSGSKLSTITKLTLDGKSEADNIYDEERNITNEASPFTINRIHVRNLKNQVSVGSWYKGKITLWSQMREMISLGLMSNGIPLDYIKDKPWNELTDAQKLKESPFWSINKRMHAVMDEIENNQQADLTEEMGLKAIITTEGIGKDKKIVTKYTGDTTKLAEYIKSQMANESMLPEELAYITNEDGTLISDLSLSVNAEKIEKILTNMVDKKLRNWKVTGEGLVQVSGAMHERKGSKPTLVDLENYGNNGLRAYYHKNGAIKSMQVKIALQGDFIKLLRLKHPDKKSIAVYSGKELDFVASLDRLNEAIRDEVWLEKYGDMITIAGPRIPTQMENSIESAIIAEFLIPIAGPIIILPEEIVAKTGSDFDHDKLMMMFMNIVIYGRGENLSVEIQKYDRSLKNVNKKLLKDKLKEENEKIVTLREKRKDLYTTRDLLWDEIKDVRDEIIKSLSAKDKARLGTLKEGWAKANGLANAAAKGIYVYTGSSDTVRQDALDAHNAQLDEIEDEQDAIKSSYIDRVKDLVKASKDIKPSTKANLTKNTKAISKVESDLLTAYESQEIAHRRFDGRSTKGLENELLALFTERITMGENMAALIQNNSVDKVYPVSQELERLVLGKYDKYNRGDAKRLKSDDGIAGTTIFDYRYNLQKHQEMSVAMDSLGIAAVMSTFHAMFTQMGATLRGVSKSDQEKFELSLAIINDASASVEDSQDAMDFVNKYSSYTLKFKHNFVEDDAGKRIQMGLRNNIEGDTISSIIGQLINGYVDVAKDAWIFNIQGNKENTPVLLFLILAGVSPKTAIYFTSSSIIREYTRMKIEMDGVYGNLTKEHGSSPVINDTSKIANKARAKMFAKYKELIAKNMNSIVTYEDANLISNTLSKEYDNKTLRGFVLPKKTSWEEFALFAHYLEIEDMSNDVTRFTANTKFATKKISSLSDVTARIINTGYAKKNLNAVPNEWYSNMETKTLNGVMSKDKFYLDLLSQYFKLRNHPMVVSASVSIKPPVGVEKTVFQNDVKNDFIAFLAQNSLYSNTTYNGVTFIQDKNDDSIIDYNMAENTYTYGANTLAEHRESIMSTLLNHGNANIELLNKFPTENHFIRYDIEYKKLQIETENMTDEEIIDNYYYAYSSKVGVVSVEAILVKVALYRSDNNIAMFDFRMGMSGILDEIVKKHPDLALQFDLVNDIKRDYDKMLQKSNQFLHNISDVDILKLYKENYEDLKYSKTPEAAEFFSRFSTMALFQTGMNRRSKYDLLRIVNNDIFETVIQNGVDLDNVFKALNKALDEKENGMRNVSTKYLDDFIELYERMIEEGTWSTRNKGANFIIEDFEGKKRKNRVAPIVSLSKANRDAMITGKSVKLAMSSDNLIAISEGNKTTTVRSNSQVIKIGLDKGESAFTNIKGSKYIVTYRGLLTVDEAGGVASLVKAEGFPKISSTSEVLPEGVYPFEFEGSIYAIKYKQTVDFLNGYAGLGVYDIRKAPVNSEVKTQSISGVKSENIFSKGSEFARKLTNPGNTLKVTYKEITFRNAEHAYQTYKSGEFDKNVFESTAFKPQGKPANKKTNFQTMVEILTAKLEQHPYLVEGINQRGGLSYIEQSTHNVTGDKFWESSGQNKFIEALADAYKSVQPTQQTNEVEVTTKISINQKDSDNIKPPC